MDLDEARRLRWHACLRKVKMGPAAARALSRRRNGEGDPTFKPYRCTFSLTLMGECQRMVEQGGSVVIEHPRLGAAVVAPRDDHRLCRGKANGMVDCHVFGQPAVFHTVPYRDVLQFCRAAACDRDEREDWWLWFAENLDRDEFDDGVELWMVLHDGKRVELGFDQHWHVGHVPSIENLQRIATALRVLSGNAPGVLA